MRDIENALSNFKAGIVIRRCAAFFAATVMACSLVYYSVASLEPLRSGSLKAVFGVFGVKEWLMAFAACALIWGVLSKVHRLFAVSKAAAVCGLITALMNILGRNYILNQSMSYLSGGGWAEWTLSLFALAGSGVLYALLFERVWALLSIGGARKNAKKAGALAFVFDRHPFICCLLIILMLTLPYRVAFYPGILNPDGLTSLDQYYGNMGWTTAFPPLTVLLLGWSMDIGKSLGSDNLGCLIYTLPQSIIFAMTLAYGFVIFKKLGTPYRIRIAALCLYVICPIFPMYGQIMVKDTNYYIAFMWLVYTFISYSGERSWKWLLVCGVSACVMCMIRNDGKYLCLLFMASVWLFRGSSEKKPIMKLTLALAAAVALSIALTQLLCGIYGIVPGSRRELFSMPAQQTARYVRDYPSDVTEEEWAVLDNFFDGRAHELGELYEPDRSDPVKGKIKYLISKAEIADYLKVWGKQFLRHPGTYFSSGFNQVYGYFYLGKPDYYKYGFSEHNPKPDQKNYLGDIKVENMPSTEGLRDDFRAFFLWTKSAPVIKYVVRPSFHTLLVALALTYILKKRRYSGLALFALPIGILLICCLSPINGANRYYMPVMCTSFIFLAYAKASVNAPTERSQA